MGDGCGGGDESRLKPLTGGLLVEQLLLVADVPQVWERSVAAIAPETESVRIVHHT